MRLVRVCRDLAVRGRRMRPLRSAVSLRQVGLTWPPPVGRDVAAPDGRRRLSPGWVLPGWAVAGGA